LLVFFQFLNIDIEIIIVCPTKLRLHESLLETFLNGKREFFIHRKDHFIKMHFIRIMMKTIHPKH